MPELRNFMRLEEISCSQCQGSGLAGGLVCQRCRGVGQGILYRSQLLTWSYDLTTVSLGRAQFSEQTILWFRIFAFVVCGAAALRYLFTVTVLGFAPSFDLFFGVGLLTGLYIYISVDREAGSQKFIYVPRLSRRPADPFKDSPIVNVADFIDDNVRRRLAKAFFLAQHLHQNLCGLHFFLAFMSDVHNQAIISRLGVRPVDIHDKAKNYLGRIVPSPLDLRRFFIAAYIESVEHQRPLVDAPVVLLTLALLDEDVRTVLYDVKIDEIKLQNVLAWQQSATRNLQRWRWYTSRARWRPHNRLDRAMTAIATPVLDYFSEDITERAQRGVMASAIARPDITAAAVRLLEEGKSVLLVGHPGVGKRSIISGVAERMVADDVPGPLRDKRLVAISLPRLVSGASAAEAEARLLDILIESQRSRNVLLAIEDIHAAVGITSGQAGSVGLIEVLRGTLGRRRLLCLATTTPEAYQQHFARTALADVFEPLQVSEPTVDESIRIVESRLGRTERKFGVYFSYDAVARLVELTTKFIHDRYQPAKSLALLDDLALFVRETRGERAVISNSDVNLLISKKYNLPVTQVNARESEILLNFETLLHQRLIDQAEAVKAVSEALRRARTEVRDRRRPVAAFLFLGPTGVGKTELAKAVAATYFGDEKRMVRLDMTEYQELGSLSRLLGSPDGTSPGVLTEAVANNPFALVLLDEIEKAHRDIVNVFLQVMDDGRLTDSRGQTVDFTNTIIIATSNAGTDFIQDGLRSGQPLATIEHGLLNDVLRPYFRPEFLNRFDRIVVFSPLNIEQVEDIAKLMLQAVSRRLAEHGVAFGATPTAIRELAQAGYDPSYGARSLRRVIQDRVDSPLARYILEGKLARRDAVTLDTNGTFSIVKAEPL